MQHSDVHAHKDVPLPEQVRNDSTANVPPPDRVRHRAVDHHAHPTPIARLSFLVHAAVPAANLLLLRANPPIDSAARQLDTHAQSVMPHAEATDDEQLRDVRTGATALAAPHHAAHHWQP